MATSRERRVQYSQNFLHSRRLVTSLVAASSIGSDDLVIEIGPGDGAITNVLMASCRHVIAIEKDPVQVSRLERRLPSAVNLTVFAADFLEFPLPHSRYKVFASIPFNATAAIVGKLTTGLAPPTDSYLVVQREAADRYLGRPHGTLAGVRISPWFDLSIAHCFRRTDFRPAPSVDSVLLRIELRERPLIDPLWRTRFEQVMTAVFAAWQPSAGAALGRLLPRDVALRVSQRMGEAAGRKPRDLASSDWIALFDVLVELDDSRVWKAVERATERQEAERSRLQKRHRTRVAG